MSAKTTAVLNAAVFSDAAKLEKLVQRAYRGGLSTVAWKNEHVLVEGPRISAGQLGELLSAQDKTILVAQTDDASSEIIGCVLIEKHDAAAHIGLLAVDPDCQNCGLGKKLLLEAERYGAEQFKCKTATMWVLSRRDELLNWYKRAGYAETGEKEPFPEESADKPLFENPHFIVISKSL